MGNKQSGEQPCRSGMQQRLLSEQKIIEQLHVPDLSQYATREEGEIHLMTEDSKIEAEAREQFNKLVANARKRDERAAEKKLKEERNVEQRSAREIEVLEAFAGRIEGFKRKDKVRKVLARIVTEERPTDTEIEDVMVFNPQYRTYSQAYTANADFRNRCKRFISSGYLAGGRKPGEPLDMNSGISIFLQTHKEIESSREQGETEASAPSVEGMYPRLTKIPKAKMSPEQILKFEYELCLAQIRIRIKDKYPPPYKTFAQAYVSVEGFSEACNKYMSGGDITPKAVMVAISWNEMLLRE